MLSIFLFLVTSFWSPPPLPIDAVANNTVKGQITMPLKSSKGLFNRGDQYRNRLKEVPSEVKKKIDEENSPDRNVVISLHPQTFTPPLTKTKDAFVRQKEKTFVPMVLPIVKGSTVYFLNEDEFYHNVFSITPKARFNIGRRPSGNTYSKVIKKTGPVKLFCDIHPQMNAVLLSFDTPYFVKADKDGSYILENIPDGVYNIQVFHPSIKKKSKTVNVKGGTVVIEDFDLTEKA